MSPAFCQLQKVGNEGGHDDDDDGDDDDDKLYVSLRNYVRVYVRLHVRVLFFSA